MISIVIILILFNADIISTSDEQSFSSTIKPKRTNYTEFPDEMSNGTLYSISDLTPKIFVKTASFELNAKTCLQFSYELFETRTRIHAYTCSLSEGGMCTLDKFHFPTHGVGCNYLRPWSHHVDTYAFYFVLERRDRKYGPLAKHRNKMKRNTHISAKPIGHLTMNGAMPCTQVCPKKNRRGIKG